MWILAGLIVLGLMVLLHEWGHFLVARLVGVRVNVFSIGFGPRLLGWKRGPTDYRISALPFGGYVAMAGENPVEEREGAADEFLSKPRWQRALIALAGPTMNVLVAVVLLAGIFFVHFERPAFLDEPAVLGVVQSGSPAAAVGLQPGDRIVKFGSRSVPSWEELLVETALVGQGPAPLTLERDGTTLQKTITLPEGVEQDPGLAGWGPDQRQVVQSVLPDSPAAAAGLQPGDELLALNGKPLRITPETRNPISEKLQQSKDQPVELTILRHGERKTVRVTPEFADHPEGERWVLGVTVGPRTVEKDLGIMGALEESVKRNIRTAGLMVELVGRLVTGGVSLRSVQGPVGIIDISAQMGAQGGLGAILNLTVAISLSLGILNLLPIPILDGGHLLMLAIEGVRRRDLSLRIKERMVQVGLVFLLLVFAIVMYNDIARIVTN